MDNPITIKTAACYECGTVQTITAPVANFLAWENGEFIQDALPMLTAGEREMPLSQTCDDCWTEMYGENEDESQENWVNS